MNWIFYSSFAVQVTMAMLQFVSVSIILVVCWSGQHVDGQGLCLCVQQDTCTQLKTQCEIITQFVEGKPNVKQV